VSPKTAGRTKSAEPDGVLRTNRSTYFLKSAGLYTGTDNVDEVLVEAGIVGKLRMKCGDEPPALAGGNGGAVR
jgi:hypothetical protein